MINLPPKYRHLALGSVLGLMGAGCITVAPNSTPSVSWKSPAKPKIEQANFEQDQDEAPRKPKNPARLKLSYGQLMEENGQYAEARKNYSEAAELQPKNVDAIMGLARLDQISGNVEEAEQGFRRALKLHPTSASTQYGIGQFYASQKRWKEASEFLTKAMLAEPDESRYRYALAVALVQTGDVDSALPHFIRTIGDAEAHYNVGLILQENGKLSEAERQFALAVAKKPEFPAAQHWLAHLREQNPGNVVPSSNAPEIGPISPVIPAGHTRMPDVTQSRSAGDSHSFGMSLTAQQREQAVNQAVQTLPN